jgi:hypothetical protein
MTVEQLIEKLREMPPYYYVVLAFPVDCPDGPVTHWSREIDVSRSSEGDAVIAAADSE